MKHGKGRPQGRPQGKPQGKSHGKPDGRPAHRAPDKTKSAFAPDTFIVDGFAAFAEYVRFKPKAIVEVLALPAERQKVDALLREHGLQVPVRERPKSTDADERMSPVAARVTLKALEPDVFHARLPSDAGAKDLVLALDHVQDPRNLGAIVRSAAFFGVRHVIVPERRQVLLTQAGVATAQGGFAIADLVVVVNLARELRELKEQGYWVIGTDMDGEPLEKLKGEYDKVVLVLGAEDTGLSKNVRELSDRVAKITGRPPGLESLNVSVAAGIMLAALTP